MIKLPEEFLETMKEMLGDEYQAFLDSYEEPRKYGLRVNTLKISPEEFQKLAPFHLEPIPWTDNGFYYLEQDQASRHAFYYAGLYYLQEPSAMTPASVLGARPGERILDLCAAPGGKATELGARLQGKGLLAANDISASRAKALLKNIEVFGISNGLVLNEVPAKLAGQFPEFFDRILVDAPCSGEGMFRKAPEVARAWYPDKPADCAKQQKEILSQAARMLRPGGRLLYSTCTFSPLENEEVIADFLEKHPEFALLPVTPMEGEAAGRAGYFAPGRPDLVRGGARAPLERCARVWPHKLPGEGHFLALLQKEGTDPVPEDGKSVACEKRRLFSEEKEGVFRGDAEAKAALEAFLRDFAGVPDWSRIEVRGGQAYYMPDCRTRLSGLRFLRCGLYLGEIRKGRFEPSQSLAMALSGREYGCAMRFSRTDERVYRYLRGETVSVDDVPAGRPKGWQLVCVDGYPLGWGKLTGGLLKNKYLAGWRLQ